MTSQLPRSGSGPGQLRLRDNDSVNEGRCQSLQFLATAGDRGCRLIQQTGNLAVCEFEGLQPGSPKFSGVSPSFGDTDHTEDR